MRNPKQPLGLLPAPANVRAKAGPVEGAVSLLWSGVVGKLTYELEYATSVNGPWTRCYNKGRARHVCEGLTPGTEYWFRVRAIGDAGASEWSNPVRRRAA